MKRPALTVTTRFVVVLVVLMPSLVGVAWIGDRGLDSMRATAQGLYQDNVLTDEATTGFLGDLDAAHAAALSVLGSPPGRARHVDATLVDTDEPAVDVDLANLQRLHAGDDPAERRDIRDLAAGWAGFTAAWSAAGPAVVDPGHAAMSAARVDGLFAAVTTSGRALIGRESTNALTGYQAALAQYTRSRREILAVLALALLAGVGVVAWLIRSVLPRTLAYSRFATDIAEGRFGQTLSVGGRDEIAQLGRTLRLMAARRQAERIYDQTQLEFTESMQLTESEEEAHRLLQHYLERSIPASTVVILNRNNSADRLEAVTDLPEDSTLCSSLTGAQPRSCLAVRQARTQQQGEGHDPLLACAVCAGCPGRSTCTPFLVGGEVIGSVLITRAAALDGEHDRRVRESVIQAAPVLANLRNLAIAELRAATDALTGLPNKRAIQDTVKRMAAQASRTVAPLGALFLDLDHFKQINDVAGHARGDDVLAALGAVLRSTLRDSDFAGRFGGEEFLVLLPDTHPAGALAFAERLRTAAAAISVTGLEQRITVSIGVAVLPDHAGDADALLRAADRALYAAKANGRNRVDVANTADSPLGISPQEPPDRDRPPAADRPGSPRPTSASRSTPASADASS